MTVHPNLKGGNFSLVHNLMYKNVIFKFILLVTILHQWYLDEDILSHGNSDQHPEKPTSTSDQNTILIVII